MWKSRVFLRCGVQSTLLLASLCLSGCHVQHTALTANQTEPPGSATGLSGGTAVQQSVEYKDAVRRYSRHDYSAALTKINYLLQQPQYQQKPTDRAFLLHQQAICRHAINPQLAVSASLAAPIYSRAPPPTPRLASQADCGPRALLLLCPQFGVHTTLDRLRKQAGTTAVGTSMQGLARAAKSIGLKAQGVQMDRQAVEQISDPAIVWYDGNHYLALLSVNGEQATVHDPNKSSEEILPVNELLGRSEGFLLTLSR